MGDRISISFTTDPDQGPFGVVEKSVILYFHWGGRQFLDVVRAYLKEIGPIPDNTHGGDPFSRRDPSYMVVNFMEWLMKNGGTLPDSIFNSPEDGDEGPGDAGLWIVNFADRKMERFKAHSRQEKDTKEG